MANVAALDAALNGVDRALLDTSTLIAFHNQHDPSNPLAEHLLRRVERDDDQLRGYFSAVSAVELLVKPLRMADETSTAYMHAFIQRFPNLKLLEVDLHVAQQAAAIRAATNLKVPDALIVACGILAGCQAIVSNDEKWRARCTPLFPIFRWLYLHDYR